MTPRPRRAMRSMNPGVRIAMPLPPHAPHCTAVATRPLPCSAGSDFFLHELWPYQHMKCTFNVGRGHNQLELQQCFFHLHSLPPFLCSLPKNAFATLSAPHSPGHARELPRMTLMWCNVRGLKQSLLIARTQGFKVSQYSHFQVRSSLSTYAS